MDINILTELLTSENQNPVFDILKNYARKTTEYLGQYDPKLHKVHDPAQRPDKQIFKPTGVVKADGTPEIREHTVHVSRISLSLQKQIVKRAAAMLCGNPIQLDFSGTDVKFDQLQKIWEDNKLDYKSKRLCKLMMAETECAELWYKKEKENRMMLLAPSFGDTLHPVFNKEGDMIAFGRSYEGTIIPEGEVKPRPVTFLEVYTEKDVWSGNNLNGNWVLIQSAHGFTKIPIIYYSQEYPEWWDVQEMIERLETLFSNNADTNDYFGSPTAVATGNIVGYASKGESGKMVQLDEGAKMEYLTWDNVPEAIKLEIENLIKNIYSLTDTPNISPEELKGLFGSAPSGYAIKLMFTAAHMKASEHEENFGESIQRRINLMKSFVGAEDLDIKPKFTYFLPKSDAEEVNVLITAVQGGIMPIELGVRQNPLIEDPDAALQMLEKQKEQEEKAIGLNDLTNGAP